MYAAGCSKILLAFSDTPVYPLSFGSGNFELKCTHLPLKLEDQRFSMDFELLENTPPTMTFLCSAILTTQGTAFTRAELERFTTGPDKESWSFAPMMCDLLLNQDSHSIGQPECRNRGAYYHPDGTAKLTTFRVLGVPLHISNLDLRVRFKRAMTGIVPDPAVMGFRLAEVAYREGEEWRESLLAYLRGNRDLAMERLSKINGLLPTLRLQLTYSGWMPEPVENPHRFLEEHGVGLSDGSDFGAPGFLRLNLGCSRTLLEQALDRIDRACASLA